MCTKSSLTPGAPADNNLRPTSRPSNQLNKVQLEFLNSEACQYVSPYSRTFWQDMKKWLAALSVQAADYPKSDTYRSALEPYLLQRVHMLARTWHPQEINDYEQLHLLLTDVCLTHVHRDSIGATPNVVVDHMHIWVSTRWFNHVRPDSLEPLVLNGVLYEYVSTKQTRNINIMPALIMPRSRKIRGASQPGCGCAARTCECELAV